MKLTKNELEVMEVLWKQGRPLTSVEIVEKSVNKGWKDSSIHILLNSLLKKQAIQEVGFVRSGKGYARTFEPTELAEDYYADMLASMVERTSVSNVIMSLFKNKDISKETIQELEDLIAQKKRELK